MLAGRFQLVLRPRIEIAGIMAFAELARRVTHRAIDHAPALYRRTRGDLVGPAHDVLVLMRLQEFRGVVRLSPRNGTVPWVNRHVSDGVVIARDEFVVRELPV